jgi:hypothetical protein
MTNIERRVAEDLKSYAAITLTEGNVMEAQQQFHERLAIATRNRNRSLLIAVAATITACLLGGWWFAHSDFRADSSEPVHQPERLGPDPQAGTVASSFVEAYAAFDVPAIRSLVDTEADTWDWEMGADWPRFNRFLEVTGGKLILEPCMTVSTTEAGTTVNCPFAYHALRSAEIGRGPFGGSSFDLTVLDGKLVGASSRFEYANNGFSKNMWEPFAAWIERTHPTDAAIMYADWPDQSSQAMSPRALRLWSQDTKAYVEYVLARRAGS